MRRGFPRVFLLSLLFPATAGHAADVDAAWVEPTASAIAEFGARLAPPDYGRQLLRRFRIYRAGVGEALAAAGTRRVDLAAEAEREARDLSTAIRLHRTFDDIARRSGRLAGWLAIANQPLRAATRDASEELYRDDFSRFVEFRRRSFALARYSRNTSDASVLAEGALARGDRFYDFVGREYRRIGGPTQSGSAGFDDRSTAFAIAAISFNHAVSDVAAALRGVWLATGGADSSPGFSFPGRPVEKPGPRTLRP